jgi:hypothetical protein
LRAVVVHDLAGCRAPHSDREAYIDLPTPQRKLLGPPGELLAITRSLIHEDQRLREAASPGFARRRPFVFDRSK